MKYYLPILLIFLCACTRNYQGYDYLMQREFSFPGTVSSLSCGEKLLWIGTETGRVASFDPEMEQYTGHSFIEYGHVYCIREMPDGLLLVGIRNAGLKLVNPDGGNGEATILTHFTLSHRGVNYSPYSFIIKRQDEHTAKETGFRCDTLFCGTSNGLFWYPLPEDTRSLGNTAELRPICGQDNDPGTRFCSVVSLGGKVYAGSNTGLYKVKNAKAAAEADRQERLGIFPVSHLSVLGNELYILDTEGNLHITEKLSQKRHCQGNPMVFFPGKNMNITVSAYGMEISDNCGHSRSIPLNGRSAIGGSNNRGRECIAEKGDFFYIATSTGICRLPKHLNLTADVSIISACEGPSEKWIYALTEECGLYRINTGTGKSRFIRNIMPESGTQVRGLAGFAEGRLVFHTSDNVYEVRPRLFSCIRKIKEMPDRTLDILSAVMSPDNEIVIMYADETFIYDSKTGILDTLAICGDSYVTAVEYITGAADNTSVMIAGTLNKGLQFIMNGKSHEKKDSAGKGYKSVLDIATAGNDTFILVPGKTSRIYNVRNGLEYTCHDEASGIFMAGGQVFATLTTGGVLTPDSEYRDIMYRDITFLPREITMKNRTGHTGDGIWLISGNGCLLHLETDSKTLEMASIYAPSVFIRIARWKGGCGLSLMILIIALILVSGIPAGKKAYIACKNWKAVYRITIDREQEAKNLVTRTGRLSILPEIYKDEANAIMDAALQLSRQKSPQYLVSDKFSKKYDGILSRYKALLTRLKDDLLPVCRHISGQADVLVRAGIISLNAAEEYEKSIGDPDPLNLYKASLFAETVGILHEYAENKATLDKLLKEKPRRKSCRLPQAIIHELERLDNATRGFRTMNTLEEINAGINQFRTDYNSFNGSEKFKADVKDFLQSSLDKSGFSHKHRFISVLSENALRPDKTFTMLIKCVSLAGQKECIRALIELSSTADRYVDEAKNCGKSHIVKVSGERLTWIREKYNAEIKHLAADIYCHLNSYEKDVMKTIRLSHYSTSRQKEEEGKQGSSATWAMMLSSINANLTQNEIRDMCLIPEQSENFDRIKSWIRLKINNFHNSEDTPGIADGPAIIIPTIMGLSEKMFKAKK